MALTRWRCDRCERVIDAHRAARAIWHRCPATGREREMEREEEGE